MFVRPRPLVEADCTVAANPGPSGEARASATQNEKYLRMRGQYLGALNHGTQEARIKAITECELRMHTELGEGAAATFVRELDPSNRAIYTQIRGTR